MRTLIKGTEKGILKADPVFIRKLTEYEKELGAIEQLLETFFRDIIKEVNNA